MQHNHNANINQLYKLNDSKDWSLEIFQEKMKGKQSKIKCSENNFINKKKVLEEKHSNYAREIKEIVIKIKMLEKKFRSFKVDDNEGTFESDWKIVRFKLTH